MQSKFVGQPDPARTDHMTERAAETLASKATDETSLICQANV